MSFSRYKALLQMSKILCNNQNNYEVKCRFYSKISIFSSPSPHELVRNNINEEKELKINDNEMFNKQRILRREERKRLVKMRDENLNKNRYYDKKLNIIEGQNNSKLDTQTKSHTMQTTVLSHEENHALLRKQIEEEVSSFKVPESKDEMFGSNVFRDNENLKYKLLDTSEGNIKYDLSVDEFNIDKFIKEFNDCIPKPLDKCEEDLSDLEPNIGPTFNFAAYADNSKLLQELVKLGVNLYKVESNQDHMRALLSLDIEKDLPVYLHFLHDCGVPADCLGDVITENPMIFKEDLDDLKTRIRYLRAHDFAKESIARIVTKNPTWLCWATKCIDERLGHFQNEFKLQGAEIRFLATKQPKLITYNFKHIHENTYVVKEIMGFTQEETKLLLLAKPRLWMSTRKKIVDTFDYLHNTMKLSHIALATHATVLTARKSRLKNRHEFLMELKKIQYDPTKPGYISPTSLVSGSDQEFCRDVAKTAVETYDLFLKTR